MVEVSTSILNIEKENSIQTFYNLETAHTNYFHIDVMDGEFVVNDTSSLMMEYCEYLKQITNIPLDVHLMVKDVESYINAYIGMEPNIITFHYEAAGNKEKIMNYIKKITDNNIKVGISIKPDTDVEEIYDFLPYIHMILIMTVEPGKGGQKLIPESIQKIQKISSYIKEKNLEIDIEVDGGINIDNVSKLKEAGANIIVAGTSIINSDDFKETIKELKK